MYPRLSPASQYFSSAPLKGFDLATSGLDLAPPRPSITGILGLIGGIGLRDLCVGCLCLMANATFFSSSVQGLTMLNRAITSADGSSMCKLISFSFLAYAAVSGESCHRSGALNQCSLASLTCPRSQDTRIEAGAWVCETHSIVHAGLGVYFRTIHIETVRVVLCKILQLHSFRFPFNQMFQPA